MNWVLQLLLYTFLVQLAEKQVPHVLTTLQFIEYDVLILCIPDFQREAIKCCRRSSHPFLYCGLLVLRLTIETLSFEMACTLEFVICNSLQHLS